MKGTLVIGRVEFKKDNGKTALIFGGAEHPDMDEKELSVLEDEWEEMWKRVRAKQAQARK